MDSELSWLSLETGRSVSREQGPRPKTEVWQEAFVHKNGWVGKCQAKLQFWRVAEQGLKLRERDKVRAGHGY